MFFSHTCKQQQLQHILSDWIKEGHSLTQAICQALLTAQQLTEQVTVKQIIINQ